mgnify:CR=1 FL=1
MIRLSDTCTVGLWHSEETQTLETKIASRAELVVCGMATIPEAVKVFAPNVAVEVKTSDGTLVPKGTTLAILRGPSNEMLQLERPVLNIVVGAVGL